MTNFTSPVLFPDFAVVRWVNTGLALLSWILCLTLTVTVIRSAFTKDDGGAMTYPLKNHLLNVLYQLLVFYPANLAYLHWPHIYLVYITCLLLAQVNIFAILSSLSNTCFYAVAVYIQIVHPMRLHVWFSPKRRRIALFLVWVIPTFYTCLPAIIHFIQENDSLAPITYCFAHILHPWFLYTFPVIGLVYLIFLLWVTISILMTSRKQANQIATLKVSYQNDANVEVQRPIRSKLTRTYFVVVILTGVILLTLLALNVVIVHCEKADCLYSYSSLVVVMCFMDGAVLTVVKFRLKPSRLRELGRHICKSS